MPKAFRYPFEGDVPPQYQAAARMTFFDAVVDQSLSVMEQFVVLGAGFDTRASRLPKHMAIQAFEVDAPKTQAVKCEMVKKAGIDVAQVTFVAADFEKEDWLDPLVVAGFDTNKPALFLWERVTMYLERNAVEDTLRKIASTAKGSVVAFDSLTTEPLTSPSLYWRYDISRVGSVIADYSRGKILVVSEPLEQAVPFMVLDRSLLIRL
jgi:methyltransferase (TIGR00027 family)